MPDAWPGPASINASSLSTELSCISSWMSTRLVAVDVDPKRGVMLRLDFTYYADASDCTSFSFTFTSFHRSPCTIQSGDPTMYNTILREFGLQYNLVLSLLYNINLQATTTTILSIRGVTIPIVLVSSATDSIWRSVVLFKPVLYHPQTLSLSSCVNRVLVAQNLQTP